MSLGTRYKFVHNHIPGSPERIDYRDVGTGPHQLMAGKLSPFQSGVGQIKPTTLDCPQQDF